MSSRPNMARLSSAEQRELPRSIALAYLRFRSRILRVLGKEPLHVTAYFGFLSSDREVRDWHVTCWREFPESKIHQMNASKDNSSGISPGHECLKDVAAQYETLLAVSESIASHRDISELVHGLAQRLG